MATETISSREARTRWRDVLDKVLTRSADVIIERSGKPVAVLIPVEDYKQLIDELDDLRASRRAAAAYKEYKEDSSIARSLEEISADLKAEGLLDE
jgi:prevent-host-death family protein